MITRQVAALVSIQGHGRVESGDSWAYIAGEYGNHGLFKSAGKAPFSQFFGRVGLLIGDLCRVNIVGIGEEIPIKLKHLQLCPNVLVHLLKFVKAF